MTPVRFAIAAVLMAVSMAAIPHVPVPSIQPDVDPCLLDYECNPFVDPNLNPNP